MEDQKILRRLNIIKGQIEGLARLIETKADCEKILPQLKAVKNAFASVSTEIVKEGLESCLQDPSKKDKLNVLLAELHKL